MPSTLFGERLKRERELRGVSLEEVAAATRIQGKFLEALENDQWDQLPGGVFNRGFIRSISKYLGLDEDSLVAEYDLATQGQKQPGSTPILPPQFQRNWTPLIVASAVIIVLLAAGVFVVARFAPRILSRLHHPRGSSAAPAPALAPPSTASADSSAASRPAAAPSAADPLQLKLEAGKPAEVTILADGQTVFDGHVEPGDSRQFEARDNFQITSSEASALLLELNGQTVPPIGSPGEPGSITLTHNDLSSPGGPH